MERNQSKSRSDRWKHLARKVVEPVPSAPGTLFEVMVCSDCETTYTTDDTHIRHESRVLCIKCEGLLVLLHQYDEMRDERDGLLNETLAAVL